MYSTLKHTCCIHMSTKRVNIEIGIMNTEMHLQIKRLRLHPCHLCVFHKYLKGNFPGRNIHQNRKFLRCNSLKLQQIFTKQILYIGVYTQEEVDSGNLQLGSRNFSFSCLRKKKKKRLILINYSAKIFEMANINVRKRQTSSVNYSLRIVREGNASASQAGSSSCAKSRTLTVCNQQLSNSWILTLLKALNWGLQPKNLPN